MLDFETYHEIKGLIEEKDYKNLTKLLRGDRQPKYIKIVNTNIHSILENKNGQLRNVSPKKIAQAQAYIETEKEKYYINSARRAIEDFFKLFKGKRGTPFYDYTKYGELVLCNGYSIIVLNDDKLLSKGLKQELFWNDFILERDIVLEDMERLEKDCCERVKCTKDLENGHVLFAPVDFPDRPYCGGMKFDKKIVSTVEKILGDEYDLEYEMSIWVPALTIKSPKGKALVLGRND